MKHVFKLFFLITTMLLFSSCASHTNFVNKYNAWVGQDIKYLISQIGYPDSTYILPNKNKVYVYEKSRIQMYPSMMPTFGYGFGGYHGGYGMLSYSPEVVQKSCKLFLETNKSGIIVQWGSRGNNCVL